MDAPEWVARILANVTPDSLKGEFGIGHRMAEAGIDPMRAYTGDLTHAEGLLLAEWAFENDQTWEEVRSIVFARLDKYLQLPAGLSWLASLMVVGIDNKRRGRKRDGVRDNLILSVLMVLRDQYGIRPTRNEATTNACGASILADALYERGFDSLGEKAVAEIWRTRPKEFR